MDNQSGHQRPAPNTSPSKQNQRSQPTASDRQLAQYNFDLNARGLPASNQTRASPYQFQAQNMPQQYPYRAGPNFAPYNGQDYPPFVPGMSFNPSYTPQIPQQSWMNPYDQSRDLAQYQVATPAKNFQYQHGYPHSNLLKSRSAIEQARPMQEQDSESAEDDQNLPRDSPAQHTDAAPSTHRTNSEPSSDENDGLQFNSYADAFATTEHLFRSKLKKIPHDDVYEVELQKRVRVLSIVNALKANDYVLPPPESKRKKTGSALLTNTEKAVWKRWQENAKQVVRVNLDQPNAAAKVELRAWEVFDEIIKIHRVGHRMSNQAADEKSKCSERVASALQAIKDFAIVRKKLIEGDNIPDFCVAPDKYARTTIGSLWNNSSRDTRNPAGPKAKAPQRTPVTNGSVARKYQPRATLSAKKKQEANESSVKDSSAEQESHSGLSSTSRIDGSLPNKEDSGNDEDAEGESVSEEESGVALSGGAQQSNDAVPAGAECETLPENQLGFGPNDLQLGNRGNPNVAHFGHTITSTYRPNAPNSMNSYGPRPSRPSGLQDNRRTATNAGGAGASVSGSTGGEIQFAHDLQGGIYDPNSQLFEGNNPYGRRNRTAGQRMTNYADAFDTRGSQSKAPEVPASKKRKL